MVSSYAKVSYMPEPGAVSVGLTTKLVAGKLTNAFRLLERKDVTGHPAIVV